MPNMTAQETQRVQTILRKEDPAVSKQMQKVEDFTSQETNRDAYREARSQGYMKYIYGGKVHSTQLKTESPTEWIETLVSNAKKQAGPKEAGTPEEGVMAEGITTGELAFRKLVIEQLANKILEEEQMKFNMKTLHKLVMEELSIVAEAPRRRRRRGLTSRWRKRGLKRGQWPQDRKRYLVPGDNRASFKKFYAAVLDAWNAGDKKPWRALGGRGRPSKRLRGGAFDYNWGDRHSKAYGILQGRTQGETGLTDKDVEGVKSLEKQAASDAPRSAKVVTPKGVTDKASAVYKHRLANDKLDTARQKLEKVEAEQKRLDDENKAMRAQVAQKKLDQGEYREKAREGYKKFKILEKQKGILIKQIDNLKKVIASYEKNMGKLDSDLARAKELGIADPQALKPSQKLLVKEYLGLVEQFLKFVTSIKTVDGDKTGWDLGDMPGVISNFGENPEALTMFTKKDLPVVQGYLKKLEKLHNKMVATGAIRAKQYDFEPMEFTAGKKKVKGGTYGVRTGVPASAEQKKVLADLKALQDIKADKEMWKMLGPKRRREVIRRINVARKKLKALERP